MCTKYTTLHWPKILFSSRFLVCSRLHESWHLNHTPIYCDMVLEEPSSNHRFAGDAVSISTNLYSHLLGTFILAGITRWCIPNTQLGTQARRIICCMHTYDISTVTAPTDIYLIKKRSNYAPFWDFLHNYESMRTAPIYLTSNNTTKLLKRGREFLGRITSRCCLCSGIAHGDQETCLDSRLAAARHSTDRRRRHCWCSC